MMSTFLRESTSVEGGQNDPYKEPEDWTLEYEEENVLFIKEKWLTKFSKSNVNG